MRGGGCRVLSPAQLDEMCELREKGWGPERIAAHFEERGTKVSASAISWQCLSLGADAPPHLRGKQAGQVEPYERGGRIVRPFSAEEDRKLREWSAGPNRLRKCEIAKRLGRKGHSVHGRLLTLARRDARREEAGL